MYDQLASEEATKLGLVARMVSAGAGGGQLIGRQLEENVQRTRIQKLRERIASLEQKVIKVKEAAAPTKTPLATARLERASVHHYFTAVLTHHASPAISNGPVWELADLMERAERGGVLQGISADVC